MVSLWQTSIVGSFWKLKRGDESSSNVQRSLLRRKRDREYGSVSLSQHEKERILSERKTLHEHFEKEGERALQGESTAQKRLSDVEVEMGRKSWERIKFVVALFETKQQLESQRLDLFQANQWADQAQKCKHKIIWIIACEEQNLPRSSRKKLKKEELRRIR